ncbi:glycosyltransferase family 2 protein [Namhaeicola litoreus]|uniref:Glycosyltransferase family 2 protein n=1 Tax=Namhaeicola litoreus TaxID=1052145 RepID=A0ABW3Y3T5_9FLAO
MKKLYSIVIPVYRSSDIVGETVFKILQVLRQRDLQGEIILVNDGSPDNSWEVIKGLAEKYEFVKAINLVKNFGQHNAVLCGFNYANGDYIITMDDDMQNPPDQILPLIDSMNDSDYDLVFGKFRSKKHAHHRKLGSKLVGYLNYKVFNKPKDITLTNFRIIKRDVIDRLLTYKTSYPYIPGLLLMFSSKIGNVDVDHAPRKVGESNYSAKKIVQLISRLLINYSSYPLRLLSSIGLFISALSFLVGLAYLLKEILLGSSVQGWTTLVVLTAFLGGFIIALLGVIGEYLSRILDQISSNKSYFVKEVIE